MKTLYIANRGEIACRIIRSARAMGLRTAVGFSDADRGSLFVEMADVAIHLGGAAAADSYLNREAILLALRQSEADMLHPGYGFLSERADFARLVQGSGIAWVGPSADVIDAMGDKENARHAMDSYGVPIVPGQSGLSSVAALRAAAESIGFPVMIKAALGGGGIGMKIVKTAEDFDAAAEEAMGRSERAFGSARVFVEKLVEQPHHVEIQVFGTTGGTVFTLPERECSVQRRHQKVIEESPSPFANAASRAALAQAAHRGAAGLSYRNAGTFEFLLSGSQQPYFLEVNTRLQVEHPVTEMVTGLDLVNLQLRTAMGEDVSAELATVKGANGHAIEYRLYAENPNNFLPSPGTITTLKWPQGEGVRIDTGVRAGDTITPYYDPMIAKIIVWGSDRAQALDRSRAALAELEIDGLKTNLPFLRELLEYPPFLAGGYDTSIVYGLRPKLK